MLTVDHYRKWAEKKRKKLLVVFSLVSALPLWLMASIYFKNGGITTSNEYFNVALWTATIFLLSFITFYLHQLKTVDWYKFLGLREVESLLRIEEEVTGNTTAYNGKHAHRDDLKSGNYRTYAWL